MFKIRFKSWDLKPTTPLLLFIFVLISAIYLLFSTEYTSAQDACDRGLTIPRADGLVSVGGAGTNDLSSRFLVGGTGACIVNTNAAFTSFKVPTYEELLNKYYLRSKSVNGITILKNEITSPNQTFGFANGTTSFPSIGLTTYYNMDQGTPPTQNVNIDDNIGGLTGNASGGIAVTTGKISNGRQVSNNTNAIITNPTTLTTGDFSISTWVYPLPMRSGNAWNVIAAQWGNGAANSPGAWNLSYSPSYEIHFHPYNCTGSYGTAQTPILQTMIPNTWNHVVVTRTSSTGRTKIYRNNNIIYDGSTSAGPLCATPLPLTIGTFTWGTNQSMNGSVDELGIWNRVLTDGTGGTPNEIGALWNNGNGLTYSATYSLQYYSSNTGNTTVTGLIGTINNAKTTVVFVNGNLNITGNIVYAGNDGTGALGNNTGLVFIVKGDVFIQDNVTDVNAAIVSYGTICSAAVGGAANPSCPTTYNTVLPTLRIYGSLSSMTASKPIKFLRNTSDVFTIPGEIVLSQPKFFYILKNIFADNLIITSSENNFPSP